MFVMLVDEYILKNHQLADFFKNDGIEKIHI
ncbi:MAG: hypothetical protein ACJA08_000775 [Cyclobacteriaceae bacterium]|jgi:hypothetical protein